jgi:hypothetical protein
MPVQAFVLRVQPAQFGGGFALPADAVSKVGHCSQL